MYSIVSILIKCELVHKEIEDFLENRNFHVHTDKLRKIVCKCCTMKHCHLGLLPLTGSTESIHAALKNCRFYKIQVTQLGTEYVHTLYRNAVNI